MPCAGFQQPAADQTRNRNRRRKSVSGTPAWATLAGGLKIRMIMILVLYENTASRAASGACCGRKGRRRVSGGQPGRSYILPFPHRGERIKKLHWHIPIVPVQCVEFLNIGFCFIPKIWGKGMPEVRQDGQQGKKLPGTSGYFLVTVQLD